MKKRVLIAGAISIALLASTANATMTECTTVCCEKKCTESITTESWQETINHREWIAAISPVVLHNAGAQKPFVHCTDPDDYDTMFLAIRDGEGEGYYLDKDGSTIWSNDRKERMYRCAPPKFTEKGIASISPKMDGYWKDWDELIYSSRSWSTTDCVDGCCVSWGEPAPVPEPTTALLFCMGVLSLAGYARMVRK